MEEVARESITLARQLAASGSYDKAFDLYLSAFDKQADLKTSHIAEFRIVVSRLNEILETANKIEEIFNNLGRTLDIFPQNIYFLNDIGKYLYKYGFYNDAWFHFQKALRIDSEFVDAEKNLNSIKNFLVERWHFRMLNDKIRNESYQAAIHQLLIPNKESVLDIGTGTGLLTLYACERKPGFMTACDSSEVMARIAEDITQDYGYDTILVVNKLSTKMNFRDVAGKRSLVITEMFDAGLFGEHVLQTLCHAWKHLLMKNGRVIPNKVEFFVVGAKCDFLNQKYQLSSSIKTLLNVLTLNVHILTQDETYDCEDVHHFGEDIKYMTEPSSVMMIDFNKACEIQEALNRTRPYEIEIKAIEDGEINTYIGWFNLYLTDKITITTDPRSKRRANAWQQAVFFDNVPKIVKENDIIDAKFLMNRGKLTMLPEYDCKIFRISPETLRFLNDIEYIKMITGCISMASVYLGQMTDMSQVNIIDLCPFPMFGLQLLKRGIRTLVCHAKTDSDKFFFIKVFKANDISLSKITILVGDEWSQDVLEEEKYHAIFCNLLEICGDIDVYFNEIAQNLKQNHLIPGGLFMPANIKIVGQIVHSHWLDINNTVFNENVSNYKIDEYLRKFQVTQNFCIDFSHLEYTPLSDPIVLGSLNNGHGTEVVSVPVIKDGHVSGILCWYNIELMDNLNEISTNRKISYIDGLAFIVNSKVHLQRGKSTNILLCVDPDGSFKLALKDGP